MKIERVDNLVWALIYGGLLGMCLGWFLQSRNGALGWAVIVIGAIVAAAGAVLIFVRSRMGP
jgi:F0F1-type ATP synthase assembly protein I